MTTRTKVPALGADGWFSHDGEPHLIGSRCTTCGTFSFPRRSQWCANPSCRGTEQTDVPLSRHGRIWSYTDAHYQPPPPYICPSEHFAPFGIAAVSLEAEGLVILGQLTAGIGVDDVRVGDEVAVVIETLYSDDEHDYLVWRWQPIGAK